MTQNTFIACDKVCDAWFNNDLSRFAIVPSTDEDPAKTAEVVEGTVADPGFITALEKISKSYQRP